MEIKCNNEIGVTKIILKIKRLQSQEKVRKIKISFFFEKEVIEPI